MIIKSGESTRVINSTLDWNQYLKYECGKHFGELYPEIDFEQLHNHMNGSIFGGIIFHITRSGIFGTEIRGKPILFEDKSLRIIVSQTIFYFK